MAKAMNYRQLFSNNFDYWNLLNLAPVGISILDSQKNIILFNKSFARITGIKRKDLINQDHKKLRYLLSNGTEMTLDQLSNFFEDYKGKILKGIVVGIKHEGEKVRFAEITVSPLDKERNYAVLIVHDITERMFLQRKQVEIELKHKSLYENSIDAILLTRPDGEILAANPAACRMLQMTEHEICFIGRIGIADTDDHRLLEALKVCSEKGKFVGELKLRRKNGEKFPAEVSASEFRIGDSSTLISMIIRDISERKKSEERLNRLTEKLRGLSRHLQEAIENERKQIARDLHDDLGQKLSALKLYFSSLRPKLNYDFDELDEKTREILRILDETIDSVNRISYGLRPRILDDLGIIAAIDDHVTEFSKATGIKCKLTYDPEEIILDNRSSIAIFRIIQASLTNISEHSKATNVNIRLRLNSNKLILTIRDNGIGIDPEKINNPRSFGISGMRERIESLGGEIQIYGIKNKGTQVLVNVPLREVRYEIDSFLRDSNHL